MPVTPPLSYPGVYIQEVSSGVRTITGVSTSIAMFVGMTNRGKINTPVRVLSFAEYQREFGNDTVMSELTEQVRQFFQNGGQQAYVMRIASGWREAGVGLKDELSGKEVLKITAKEAGAVGNTIRLQVDYNTPTPESSFNLRVFRQGSDGQGGFREEAEEVFRGLSMDPDGGSFAVDVINRDSNLIKAEPGNDVNDPTIEPFQGYALSGRLFDNEAELKAEIVEAINKTGAGGTGGTVGRFMVSVDRCRFIEVSISKSDITAEAAASDLAKAINKFLRLNLPGVTVTASLVTGPDSKQYLRVQSKADGGSVMFRPAATNDITQYLELGLEQGGFEVDGHVRRRPAPTGLFFRLGAFDPQSGAPISALTNLADKSPGDINKYTLEDNAGTHTFDVDLGSGGKLYEKDNEPPSLKHLKERLEIFAAKLNADAADDTGFNWSAEVHGYRLVLKPNVGNANYIPTQFTTKGDESSTVELGYNMGGNGNGMDQPNVRYYSLGQFGESNYQVIPGTDGFDGNTPTPDEYAESFDKIGREVDLFNLLILPRANNGQSDADRAKLWEIASKFCQKRRAFLLIDPPSTWTSPSKAERGITQLRIGLVKDHSAVYWPRVKVNATKSIDPSGSIAGLMARIDASRGVWKAPAGTEADLRGVRGVEYLMDDAQNGLINPQAVNAVRLFPNGIVSWGARTLDGFEYSGNTDYQYVPVRRLALFLEESLYRGLKWVVFEPNGESLWSQIRLNAGAFMQNLFRQGAFKGQTPKEAYFVKCDSETTTQDDINRGIVNIWVGFAPLKPAEFVILYLHQVTGQTANS